MSRFPMTSIQEKGESQTALAGVSCRYGDNPSARHTGTPRKGSFDAGEALRPWACPPLQAMVTTGGVMISRARPAGKRMAVERMHACFQTPAVVALHAAAVHPPGTRSSHCYGEHERAERGG